MTVIAYDGHTLAADKRAVNNGVPFTVTKLFRVGDAAVAYSGDASYGQQMLAWFIAGAVPEEYPDNDRDDNTCRTNLVVVDADGLRVYESTPYPICIEDTFWAGGSGRDAALATLHLGGTAEEAVRVASLIDTGCGNGIDSLEVLCPAAE